MPKTIVVHTRATPSDPLLEERESLDAPDIDLRLLGRCNTPEAVLEAVRDADIALCMDEPYTREVLANAPRLKMVFRYGVGVDTIDLQAATDNGIMVGHLPDFCTEEVANHALVHLLICAKKVLQLDHAIRTESYAKARSLMAPMGAIHGETLGLLAFGRIGRAVALRAQTLGMEVIAYDPYVSAEAFEAAGVEPAGLDELAARSDYVSCHLPLNEHTRGLLNADFFSKMKPSAYLINTGRGPVVNEPDLIAALRAGRIAGAGLDVFESEPLASDHPFCSMPNVTLTPHSASYADSTMSVRARRVGQNVLTVARGGLPEFVANPAVLAHRRT